jgi:hypothetical protein
MKGHRQSGGQWNVALDLYVGSLGVASSEAWSKSYAGTSILMPRLFTKDLAQYLPKLRHQEEHSEQRGEGRVSSFNIRLLEINLQPWHILELVTIAQSLK